jgi:hypothetical protein
MKIRRAAQKHRLRETPIDGFDMFLLSLVEEEISLAQLAEISSRSALETVRHVLRLGRLGLVVLRHESPDERLLADGWDESAAQELLDEAHTLRPPAHARASAPRVTLPGVGAEPTTGIRRRPTPAGNEPVNLSAGRNQKAGA